MTPAIANTRHVRHTAEGYPYEFWDGSTLAGDVIAFDTETAAIVGHEIPALAILVATDGERTFVVSAESAGDFLALHSYRPREWVGHNAAFDYFALQKPITLEIAAAQGRLHDTMLMDFLVRLAADEKSFDGMRNLGLVARQYAGMDVDKDNPLRTRFGEIIGLPLSNVPPAYFDYAIPDVVATYKAWDALNKRADKVLANNCVEISPELVAKYGLLTETLQVRASIALADIGHRGIAIDTAYREQVHEKLMADAEKKIEWMDGECPGLFKKYKIKSKAGEFMLTPTGLPKMNLEALRVKLAEIASRHGITPPLTPKTREIQTGLAWWHNNVYDNNFIRQWGELVDLSKTLQFVAQVEEAVIHTSYRTIVRTGRTSARDPNIQQMPRDNWFRRIFVPRAGYKFVIADYTAIELYTLAAVLLDRYGESQLATVLKEGVDPHKYTAALMKGISYPEYLQFEQREPERAKHSRQAAKALNFGIPGGLGPNRLVMYAKTQYGVELSVEQAEQFRQKLITEVYPELELYLDDSGMSNLAFNLECTPNDLWEAMDSSDRPGWMPRCIAKVVAGKAIRADGEPYKPFFVKKIWDALISCCYAGEPLESALASRTGSLDLHRHLFGTAVTTLTGRVRSGADYGEARNTPFQGLASDGSKVALWELVSQGERPVAFIHDEIVLEVLADRAKEHGARIAEIMVKSMKSVLHTPDEWDLPVKVEYKIADSWCK